jgi:hypothetical protein
MLSSKGASQFPRNVVVRTPRARIILSGSTTCIATCDILVGRETNINPCMPDSPVSGFLES